MIIVSLQANEENRLEVLHQLQILDTDAEERFDKLTKLAAEICEMPVASICFVTADTTWYKAQIGFSFPEEKRQKSFSNLIVKSSLPLIVTDTHKDDRFKNHPLVVEPPNFRYYAGFPLTTQDKFVVGVLSVMDFHPNDLTQSQIKTLVNLAELVIGQLELNRAAARLTQASAERDQYKSQITVNEK